MWFDDMEGVIWGMVILGFIGMISVLGAFGYWFYKLLF